MHVLVLNTIGANSQFCLYPTRRWPSHPKLPKKPVDMQKPGADDIKGMPEIKDIDFCLRFIKAEGIANSSTAVFLKSVIFLKPNSLV